MEAIIASLGGGTWEEDFEDAKLDGDAPSFGDVALESHMPTASDLPVVSESSDNNLAGGDTSRVEMNNVDWVPVQDPVSVSARQAPIRMKPMTGPLEQPGTLRYETLLRSAESAARSEGVLHATLAGLLGPAVVANSTTSIYALAVRAIMTLDAVESGALVDGRPRQPIHVWSCFTNDWPDVDEQYRSATRVPVLAEHNGDFVSILLTLMIEGGMGGLTWAYRDGRTMPAGARIYMPGGTNRFLLICERRDPPLNVVVGGACLRAPELRSFIERLEDVMGSRALGHAARTAAALSRVYVPPDYGDLDARAINFVAREGEFRAANGDPVAPPMREPPGGGGAAPDPGVNPANPGYYVARVGLNFRRAEAEAVAAIRPCLADGENIVNVTIQGGNAEHNGRRMLALLATRVDGRVVEQEALFEFGLNGAFRDYLPVAFPDGRRPPPVDRYMALCAAREGTLMPGRNDERGPANTTRLYGVRNVYGQIDGLSTLTAPTLEADGLMATIIRICVPSRSGGVRHFSRSIANTRKLLDIEATRIHLFAHRALYMAQLVPARQLGQLGGGILGVMPRGARSMTVPLRWHHTSMPYGSLECLEDGSWFRDQREDAPFATYVSAGSWHVAKESNVASANDDKGSRIALDAALRLSHVMGGALDVLVPPLHPVAVPCLRVGVAHPFGFPLWVPLPRGGFTKGEVAFHGGAAMAFGGSKTPAYRRRRIVAQIGHPRGM